MKTTSIDITAKFHLEGSLEPIFIELLLEVDHVSLLEAELTGVLRLKVVESLENITYILPVKLCFTNQNVLVQEEVFIS